MKQKVFKEESSVVNGDLVFGRCYLADDPDRRLQRYRLRRPFRLPKGLAVKGHLCLNKCPITSLPEDLSVEYSLTLDSCHALASLPKGLRTGWGLSIEESPISSLPEDLDVSGLRLQNCPNLSSLPNGLKVIKRSLSLQFCSTLASLPEGLEIGEYLYLSWCYGLESLPKGLKVGMGMSIYACLVTSSPA
jgi:hypothetical protein